MYWTRLSPPRKATLEAPRKTWAPHEITRLEVSVAAGDATSGRT